MEKISIKKEYLYRFSTISSKKITYLSERRN
jgi:hypothetical protein